MLNSQMEHQKDQQTLGLASLYIKASMNTQLILRSPLIPDAQYLEIPLLN